MSLLLNLKTRAFQPGRWWPLVVVAAALNGCTIDHLKAAADPADPEVVTRSGMLIIIDPSVCQLPEGCGPRYRLMDERFQSWLPLEGTIDQSLSERVITVTGTVKSGQTGEADKSVTVSHIEPHTTLPYHSFLVEAASRYTKSRYGCKVEWNKSYSWKLRAGVGWISVRMTNTHLPGEKKPFIELWYNGDNGLFIKELSALGSTFPCQ
jgi:hypothetical protein